MLDFTSAGKTALANTSSTPHVVGDVFAAATSAHVLDHTGALDVAIQNLTYTVNNGVITFGATTGHSIADFTSGQLVSAAEIIVNSTGVGNEVAAFVTGGNTYVVTSDGASTLSGGSGQNFDSLITLDGMTSVNGFGSTGAVGTIVSSDVTNLDSGVANSGTAAVAVYNEATAAAGHSSAAESITVFGTTSTAITNLAASGTLTLNDGGNTVAPVTISQTGTAGNNSLTLNLGTNDTFKSITMNGDYTLAISSNDATITSLVDASSTLNTITLLGNDSLGITGITDSALQTIDGTAMANTLYLGDTSAHLIAGGNSIVSSLTQTGLSILLATTENSYVSASGAGDTITQGSTTTNNYSSGVDHITANGAGDTLTVSSTSGGNTITANGANDTIALGNNGTSGSYTVTATGSGDHISFTATNTGGGTVTVGSNAVVTLGAGSDTIVVTNDTTGGSSASYNFTTLNNAMDNVTDAVNFTTTGISAMLLSSANGNGSSVAASQVNVATATSLAQALDIAANITALTQQPGTALSSNNVAGEATNGVISNHTGVVDWFQYGGNTYLVESVNTGSSQATHTALGAHDIVVELVGLVNIGANGGLAGSTVTL